MGCADLLNATLVYPCQERKYLTLYDTYDCHTVGCQPGARQYQFFWCADLGGYIHGGIDVRGHEGDNLQACYAGLIRWVNLGPAFGYNQFVIQDALGVCFFYAHTSSRPRAGTTVKAGDYVAHMSHQSSYPIAAHLHLSVFTDLSNPTHTTVNPFDALDDARQA